MAHPFDEHERDELIVYAIALLRQAVGKLEKAVEENESVAGASWRIADALGSLSFISEPNTGGIDKFTGLGFRLERVDTK